MAAMTVIQLPFPISLNAMFSDGKTRRHKSQRYADWLIEAGYALNRQRPIPVKGPVNLIFEFQEGRDNRKHDVTNLIKGPEDLLVKHGIIEADDGSIVRKVEACWNAEVEGMRVTVESIFGVTA